MIFASCSRCGYAMDIFQEPSQLIHAPLACPRCGGLDLDLQLTEDLEGEAAQKTTISELVRVGRGAPRHAGDLRPNYPACIQRPTPSRRRAPTQDRPGHSGNQLTRS